MSLDTPVDVYVDVRIESAASIEARQVTALARLLGLPRAEAGEGVDPRDHQAASPGGDPGSRDRTAGDRGLRH
jgi:hypothetical protein